MKKYLIQSQLERLYSEEDFVMDILNLQFVSNHKNYLWCKTILLQY